MLRLALCDDRSEDLCALHKLVEAYQRARPGLELALYPYPSASGVLDAGVDFDVFLLDILMPGLTGFDVLIDMNKNNRMENIPVIMITADDSDANIRRAFSLGALDYISRPFDSQIVYRRVSNTIMLYTKQRKLISMLTQQYREREK